MTGGDGQQYCSVWDSANLAATYFALAALAVLRTGIERVRRRECLEWVRRLQRGNGSFGEGLGKGGHIEGEWPGDVRFCYFAAGVRWFLRRGGGDGVRDVDVEGLAEFVQGSVVSRILSAVRAWGKGERETEGLVMLMLMVADV